MNYSFQDIISGLKQQQQQSLSALHVLWSEFLMSHSFRIPHTFVIVTFGNDKLTKL